MLNRIFATLSGLFLAGVFGFIGYHLLIGDPIKTTSRKTALFRQAQDWLIDTLGMTNAGYAVIAFGVVSGVLAYYGTLSDDDDDE